jgi:hypothetical protein
MDVFASEISLATGAIVVRENAGRHVLACRSSVFSLSVIAGGKNATTFRNGI